MGNCDLKNCKELFHKEDSSQKIVEAKAKEAKVIIESTKLE